MPQPFTQFEISTTNQNALAEAFNDCFQNYKLKAGTEFIISKLLELLKTRVTFEQRSQALSNLQRIIQNEKDGSQFLVDCLKKKPTKIKDFIEKYKLFAEESEDNQKTLLEALNKKLFDILEKPAQDPFSLEEKEQQRTRKRRKVSVIPKYKDAKLLTGTKPSKADDKTTETNESIDPENQDKLSSERPSQRKARVHNVTPPPILPEFNFDKSLDELMDLMEKSITSDNSKESEPDLYLTVPEPVHQPPAHQAEERPIGNSYSQNLGLQTHHPVTFGPAPFNRFQTHQAWQEPIGNTFSQNQRLQTHPPVTLGPPPYNWYQTHHDLHENYRQATLQYINDKQLELESMSSQLNPSKMCTLTIGMMYKIDLAINKHLSIKIIKSKYSDNLFHETQINEIQKFENIDSLLQFLKNYEIEEKTLATYIGEAERDHDEQLKILKTKYENLKPKISNIKFDPVGLGHRITANKDLISKLFSAESISSMMYQQDTQKKDLQQQFQEQKKIFSTLSFKDKDFQRFERLALKISNNLDKYIPCLEANGKDFLDQALTDFNHAIEFLSRNLTMQTWEVIRWIDRLPEQKKEQNDKSR